MILEHIRNPRGQGELTPCDADHEEANRLCGDSVRVFLRSEPGGAVRIGFVTKSCAFCRASASIMVACLDNAARSDVVQSAERFLRDYAADAKRAQAILPGTEPLDALRIYPTRARCVLLPWQALDLALKRMP